MPQGLLEPNRRIEDAIGQEPAVTDGLIVPIVENKQAAACLDSISAVIKIPDFHVVHAFLSYRNRFSIGGTGLSILFTTKAW